MPKCLRCGAGSEWIQGRVPKESAVDSLTAEQKLEEKAAINTNVRLFDLVRFMRGELHDAGLITNSEYFWLVSNSDITESGKGGSPSPRRLEDYDELAAKLEQANAKIKNFEQLREGDFKLVRDFAEGVGIKIMASNKLPGRQWEQFAQGIYDMQAKLAQANADKDRPTDIRQCDECCYAEEVTQCPQCGGRLRSIETATAKLTEEN